MSLHNCDVCGIKWTLHHADPCIPEPSELPSSTGSARPFEQQTTLEKVLRAHLWQPQELLRRCEERLPKLVKKKEYEEAGECQTRIIKAEAEIKVWTHLLELYESERQSPND